MNVVNFENGAKANAVKSPDWTENVFLRLFADCSIAQFPEVLFQIDAQFLLHIAD